MSLLHRKLIPQLDQATLNGIRWDGLPEKYSHIRATLMYANGNYDYRDFRMYWESWTEEQQRESRKILLDINNTYWTAKHRETNEVHS